MSVADESAKQLCSRLGVIYSVNQDSTWPDQFTTNSKL
jgi:hypothetical protein